MLRARSMPSSPHNSVVLETKAHLEPNLGLGSMSSIVNMVILPTQVVAMKPRKGNKFRLEMETQLYKSFLNVDCKTLSLATPKNHKHFQSTCVIISMSPFIGFFKFVV